MAMTKDQTLAFVRVLNHGKAAVHLEAMMGSGQVASASDFASDIPKCTDLCEDFCDQLDEYLSAMRALVAQNRAAYEKRKAKEKANTIPGVPTEFEAEEPKPAARRKAQA